MKQAANQQINDTISKLKRMGVFDQQVQEQPFVTGVPGYGNLTLDQYKALPTSDREYITHFIASRELGEKPMSREEFNKLDSKDKIPTTAMGAAIKQYVDETGTTPSPSKLAEWTEMFREDSGPGEVSWTTATNNLTKRFGDLDETGQWVVTPELQRVHQKAQEILVDLKREGLEPLEAINQAEIEALEWQDKVERNYFNYIDKYRNNEEMVDLITSKFQEKYGYVPSRRF